jgi:hypothetical protein
MPKKITNPLRSGLPSKIYFLAYAKPTSGYRIAQQIYRQTYAPTSKIYSWTKKLEKNGIITKTNRGILSKVEPLVTEIEKVLNRRYNLELSNTEKHIVLRLLDSPEFRSFFQNKRVGFDQDFDAVRVLVEYLGNLCHSISLLSTFLGLRIDSYKNEIDFDKNWNSLGIENKESKLNEIIRIIEKEDIKKKIKNFFQTNEETDVDEDNYFELARLLVIPSELLSKLEKLSNIGDFSRAINYFLLMLARLKTKEKSREEKQIKNLIVIEESRLKKLSEKYPEAIKELLEVKENDHY